jgi:hypothetical protein
MLDEPKVDGRELGVIELRANRHEQGVVAGALLQVLGRFKLLLEVCQS